MGYAEYLKDLLRPLRLYELDEGDGCAELEAEGGPIHHAAIEARDALKGKL